MLLCDVIPCSVVLFPDQSEKPDVISHHKAAKKVITFDSIPFQQL
jgi:hypothetical protein